MKKRQYYNPATGQWTDHCPWPDGKVPDGGRISVESTMMDGLPPDVVAQLSGNKTAMTDEQRTQAYEDAFNRERDRRPCGGTFYPVNDAYADYCASLGNAHAATVAQQDADQDTAAQRSNLVDNGYSEYVRRLNDPNYRGAA